YTEGKIARAKAVDALREEVKRSILEKHPEADSFAISQAFDYVQKKAFRVSILDKQKRVDGRSYQDLRPISCEVSVLPRAHGSAIFQRGESHFHYAVRISSEIMASNGSTSMASVCAGTLALMDAGVPLKTPVAGISVGLVTEFGDDRQLKRYELLTDIIGSEDHFGDMDF